MVGIGRLDFDPDQGLLMSYLVALWGQVWASVLGESLVVDRGESRDHATLG